MYESFFNLHKKPFELLPDPEFIYLSRSHKKALTYLDYGKCSTAETPKIEVIHRPSPSPFTPLGQKAAGEGAAIPSPAAIASAVEDALAPLGVKIRGLPLTPEAVWRLVHGRGSEKEGA